MSLHIISKHSSERTEKTTPLATPSLSFFTIRAQRFFSLFCSSFSHSRVFFAFSFNTAFLSHTHFLFLPLSSSLCVCLSFILSPLFLFFAFLCCSLAFFSFVASLLSLTLFFSFIPSIFLHFPPFIPFCLIHFFRSSKKPSTKHTLKLKV